MYHLTVRDHIMIAHSLPDPAFGPAQNLHGATFVVELTIAARQLNEHGVVINIEDARSLLADVLADLKYRNLDDHPDLDGVLTTTEVLARFILDRVTSLLPAGEFARLELVLRESPDAWTGYSLDLD